MLLALAIVALCTLLIWTFGQTEVDRFGHWVYKSYETHYSKRLREAERKLGQDRRQGIEETEALLEDLRPIKKRDRLDPIKRRALELLTQALSQERKELERAIYWADHWVHFDERDLNAKVRRVQLLRRIPERRAEAIDLISKLYHMVPEEEPVVQLYVETLTEQGRVNDAFSAVSDYVEHYLSVTAPSLWQIYWDSGNGFNAKQSKKITWFVDGGRRLTLPLDLPVPIRRLRLDPPPFSQFVISEPKLVIKIDGKESTLQLWKIPLGLHQMIQAGEKLETSGEEDPYFFWDLPRESRGRKLVVIIKAKVSRLLSLWVVRFMAKPEVTALTEALAAAGEEETVQRLQKLMAQTSRQQ